MTENFIRRYQAGRIMYYLLAHTANFRNWFTQNLIVISLRAKRFLGVVLVYRISM